MKEEKSIPPEQVMAALFEGRERLDQMALLARLEHGGASIYRAWAGAELNVKAREALLAAAEREEANSKLLRLMSTPKGECEKCQAPLAPESNFEFRRRSGCCRRRPCSRPEPLHAALRIQRSFASSRIRRPTHPPPRIAD